MAQRPPSGKQAAVSEAEVVYWLKRALVRRQFFGDAPTDILVDADGAYLSSPFRKHLEPTGALRIGNWRADLLCILCDQDVERVVGFEVKARSDLEKGVVQAGRYRAGVHESYLCTAEVDRPTLSWLAVSARNNGIGLVMASEAGVDIQVPPPPALPDPRTLLSTRRYLLGEGSVRSFGLNKPLHYVAVLIACRASRDPISELTMTWGLKGSSARLAYRGAATLGLIADGQPTLKGGAYADAFTALGFSLSRDRHLTGARLVEHSPPYAAVLRTIMLDSAPVMLIMRTLDLPGGGPVSADRLAARAGAMDEGLARAVFGEPPLSGERWQIRPSTRFNVKAAMYDVGLLSSPLAKGASGRSGGVYEATRDLWQLEAT